MVKSVWFLCALCLTICLTEHIYTNSWAINLSGQPEHIERIARKYGFLNLGKIFADGDYYHMKQRMVAEQSLQAYHSHNLRLEKDPMVLWFAQQAGKPRKRRQLSSPPNDPLFSKQWFLTDEFSQNVVAAWARGYTGKGVVVTVLDDGIEKSHPDLSENYDPKASYDMNDNDANPEPSYSQITENRHGTRCAGVVAAVANNAVCGVGVAFQAKIGAIRMLDGHVTDLLEAKSFNFNQQHIDIYSASWGPKDDGKTVDGPGTLASIAFIRGISNGRGGLGSIYVWASGNGGTSFDNCNCDGYSSSIYTLSVGSATEQGTVPHYSEPCSSILTTTYSGGNLHHRKIVTTDVLHSCTSDYSGTSASTPLAAGIIALALEANPTLTWRDVQHLTVRASRPAGLRTRDWHTNGIGRPVSHYYGYGLLDASKMVDLARKWDPVQPQRKCLSDVITSTHELRGNLTLKWNETACLRTKNWIRSLEHVQARLTLTYTRRGALSIILISPMGTRSTLVTVRPSDSSPMGYYDWAFMSTHSWDEDPSGLWTLQIENRGDPSYRGFLTRFQLNLYGTEERVLERHMEGTVVQPCIVKSSDGGCKECTYPLYMFERICLASCPPHYYELGRNSTQSDRRCLPCHRTCHTCFGEGKDSCLDCPPYSTLDPLLGTCSFPFYPRDHRRMAKDGMELALAAFGILLGGPVLVLCLLWASTLMRSAPASPDPVARNQVNDTNEADRVEMVTICMTRDGPIRDSEDNTVSDIPENSREI